MDASPVSLDPSIAVLQSCVASCCPAVSETERGNVANMSYSLCDSRRAYTRIRSSPLSDWRKLRTPALTVSVVPSYATLQGH